MAPKFSPSLTILKQKTQAVQDYYSLMVKYSGISHPKRSLSAKPRSSITEADLPNFDDDSVVIVTKSDLDGYDRDNEELGAMSIASQPATARFSCLWPGSYSFQRKQGSSSLFGVNILRNLGIGIRVYWDLYAFVSRLMSLYPNQRMVPKVGFSLSLVIQCLSVGKM